MSETVPSGGETGGAARLLASARERLSVAAVDLALPARLRLSEWHRTTIAALLTGLIRGIEDELRAALATHFIGSEGVHAALTSHVAIAGPILEGSDILLGPELIGALLRRAEEHRLHRSASPESALLIELAGDAQEEVASEAMALLIAQSGRLDRFQEPIMARTELAAETQHGLVWAIAAALRLYLVERQAVAAAEADRAVADAAGRMLAGYDEGQRVEAMAQRLAAFLLRHGRLDDALVGRSIGDGNLPLFLASLSVRSGVEPDAAWELLSAPDGSGPALLLRAAGVGRAEAGAILFRLDEERAAERIDQFDATGEAEAGGMVGLWQTDPGYRSAIARLRQ